jgi:hypothetical protein
MGKFMTLIVVAITAVIEIVLLLTHLHLKERKSKKLALKPKPRRTITIHPPVQVAPPAWMTQDLATGDRRMDRLDTNGLEVVEIDYDTNSETYNEFVRAMRSGS